MVVGDWTLAGIRPSELPPPPLSLSLSHFFFFGLYRNGCPSYELYLSPSLPSNLMPFRILTGWFFIY